MTTILSSLTLPFFIKLIIEIQNNYSNIIFLENIFLVENNSDIFQFNNFESTYNKTISFAYAQTSYTTSLTEITPNSY